MSRAASDIVLTTYVARWIHAAFGLRYLRANLGELIRRSEILEFTLDVSAADAAEAILARRPRIVGIGVYIWNAREALALVRLLRQVAPDLTIVVGGPEVSHEVDSQDITALADHVVTGEGDLAFAALCRQLLDGERVDDHVIRATPPRPEELVLPYDLYDRDDLAHRVIYVEASRGCPFRCEFCLSSLDRGVRSFETERFLGELERLWERGARHFKFVDRTFNLREETTVRILEFFADRADEGAFAHFEMIPDRLPSGLRDVIRRFPPGTLQFEVGIQTFDPDVARRISRRQDYGRLEDNLRFLRDETNVHVHADLIVGLPGESMATFGAGFDRLVELAPQEIQVGILKRLRGTPIIRWDEEFETVWSTDPPYEILANKHFDFHALQRLKRFSRYWDLMGNSGRFLHSLPYVWCERGPFESFIELADYLWERTGRTSKLSPMKLFEALFEFLSQRGALGDAAGAALARDWSRMGRHDVPPYLHPWRELAERREDQDGGGAPPRQARFVAQ